MEHSHSFSSFVLRARRNVYILPITLFKFRFLYSLLVVSSILAKLLHLYTHRGSLPILLFFLYLPTFLLTDFALIFGSKLLFFRNEKLGVCSPVRLLAIILSYITAIASVCQIAFYLETGGEIQWTAGASLASDPAGLALLLSGLSTFAITFIVVVGASWLLTPFLFDAAGSAITALCSAIRECRNLVMSEDRQNMDLESDQKLLETASKKSFIPSVRRAIMILIATTAASITCLILQTVRPTTPPYAHMSGTIPFVMLESLLLSPTNADFCLPHPHGRVDFPFEAMSSNATLESMSQDSDFWAPRSERCKKRVRHHRHHHHHKGDLHVEARNLNEEPQLAYDPTCDPLKISNLDNEVLEPIVSSLASAGGSIKHVVLLTLESTRKDFFPFKRESHAYRKIVASHGIAGDFSALNDKLSHLTPVSELLTSEPSGFGLLYENPTWQLRHRNWTTRFNGSYGAINVQGAQTGSDYTFKSLVGSHCGVEPLPVDFTEEVKGQIYQPCIPHILRKLNEELADVSLEEIQSNEPKFLSTPWEYVMVQSITDRFDSQDILDRDMGFRHIVTRETMLDPSSKYFPPKEPEANYFGFPETETLPYLRDLFTEAESNNRRLFLSHVTSSTHHPFHTPRSWEGHEDYVSMSRWGSEDPFNDYINTIKYQDEWIGTIFNLLEETGVIDQTLVVIVGDHGMAFDSVDGSSQTYQNGHISNFRVPLLFVHPQLPRIQLKAKTTSLSIIPTILDLLVQTGSLTRRNTDTVQELIQQYQGQSLIREFIPSKDGGRQLWYFGMINPGGSMMVISSAATSYRLLVPLCSSTQFKFTDIEEDPQELDGLTEWTIEKMEQKVRKEVGKEAAVWVAQAEKLGRWWFWEQKRRWQYHKAARSTDRNANDQGGRFQKEHWWNT